MTTRSVYFFRTLWRLIKLIIKARSNLRNEITCDHHESGYVEFWLADTVRIEPKSLADCEAMRIFGFVVLSKGGRFIAWCSVDTWHKIEGFAS